MSTCLDETPVRLNAAAPSEKNVSQPIKNAERKAPRFANRKWAKPPKVPVQMNSSSLIRLRTKNDDLGSCKQVKSGMRSLEAVARSHLQRREKMLDHLKSKQSFEVVMSSQDDKTDPFTHKNSDIVFRKMADIAAKRISMDGDSKDERTSYIGFIRDHSECLQSSVQAPNLQKLLDKVVTKQMGVEELKPPTEEFQQQMKIDENIIEATA